MRSSIVALFGLAALVAAVPPAATFCSEDNLLRAFQHTPTAACGYCATSTAGPYPTFLAVATYPPTRLSSACSCFSAYPTDRGTPSCAATSFAFAHNGDTYGTQANMIFGIDRSQPCGTGGFKVISICGYWSGTCSTFNPTLYNTATSDNCYYPDTYPHVADVPGGGVAWYGQGGIQSIYFDSSVGEYRIGGQGQGPDTYSGDFQVIPCGTCYVCPGGSCPNSTPM